MARLKEYQKKLIYQLSQQELMIADLYRIFAGQFPDHCDFWLGLSADELEHASWMEYLFKKAEEGLVHFDEQRTKTYTVEAFLVFLTSTIESVKADGPDLAKAISLTRNIERSLLEKRIFDFFTTTDREMLGVLKDLQAKMARHVSDAERTLDRLQTLGPS